MRRLRSAGEIVPRGDLRYKGPCRANFLSFYFSSGITHVRDQVPRTVGRGRSWPRRPSPTRPSASASRAQAFLFRGGEEGAGRGYARIDNKKIRTKSQVYEPHLVVIMDASLMDIVNATAGLRPGGKWS